MAYFSYFPKVEYDVRDTGNNTVMTNLTKRIRLRDYFKKNAVNFDYYWCKNSYINRFGISVQLWDRWIKPL